LVPNCKSEVVPDVDESSESGAFSAAFTRARREQAFGVLSAAAIRRSLNSHGMFWCSRSGKRAAIATHSFDHGGGHFYRFRLHHANLCATASSLGALRGFLLSVAYDCPNHFFREGPRVSARRWCHYPPADPLRECPLPQMAVDGIQAGRYKGAHDNVEVHCLENDSGSIAVEVPVWWERPEMGPFCLSFPDTGPLTGHIDLLRVVDSTIEVWDCKPDVEKADTVGMQVLVYALMLAVRTGIPLDRFRCGYFDTRTAWSFSPSSVPIRPTSPTDK